MSMGTVIDYRQPDQQIENKLWTKEEAGEPLNAEEKKLLDLLKTDREAFEQEVAMRREKAAGSERGPNVLERQRDRPEGEDKDKNKPKQGQIKAPFGLKWLFD